MSQGRSPERFALGITLRRVGGSVGFRYQLGNARAMSTRFSISAGDICEAPGDVVLLKYAGGFHGADWAVAHRLMQRGVTTTARLQVGVGQGIIVDTGGAVAAKRALFLGVPPLFTFGYAEMARFARNAVNFLAAECRLINMLVTTIHGAGYGLDAEESLQRLYHGFLQGLEENPSLTVGEISFLEIDARRATLLTRTLEELELERPARRPPAAAKDPPASPPPAAGQDPSNQSAPAPVPSPSDQSAMPAGPSAKRHVFVAMPFSDEFEDVFVFGIYEPVRQCGLICEKTNETAYTGDILHRIRTRIESSSLVIADMTGARPNVYLEVGYAWGKGVPVLFIAKEGEQLHFDVSRHRCVHYRSIRQLAKELAKLIPDLIGPEPS
jgi:hypothetical protein